MAFGCVLRAPQVRACLGNRFVTEQPRPRESLRCGARGWRRGRKHSLCSGTRSLTVVLPNPMWALTGFRLEDAHVCREDEGIPLEEGVLLHIRAETARGWRNTVGIQRGRATSVVGGVGPHFLSNSRTHAHARARQWPLCSLYPGDLHGSKGVTKG